MCRSINAAKTEISSIELKQTFYFSFRDFLCTMYNAYMFFI